MSETEDVPSITENSEEEKVGGRSCSIDDPDAHQDNPAEGAKVQAKVEEKTEDKEDREEKKESEEASEEKKATEGKEKSTESAASTCPASPTTDVAEQSSAARSDSVEQRDDTPTSLTASGASDDKEARCVGDKNTAVGEWNSLPVLVERLRAALELSLATGSRRDDEPPALQPEDSGVDSEEDFRSRNSTEQVAIDGNEPELKKDINFIEDLLLSDVQSALSRLRITLEKVDVASLTKHGAVTDSSSKLHLLGLVSSLLSRLQVSEEAVPEAKQPITEATPLFNRRRRPTRHTIGVTAKELAQARKWLEEEKHNVAISELPIVKQQKEELRFLDSTANSVTSSTDKRTEEIHDKCTKDAINQRQSQRDKNKETRQENCAFRDIPSQTLLVKIEDTKPKDVLNMSHQLDSSYQNKGHENVSNEDYEDYEQSRVSQLAAALRQRAELSTSGGKFGSNKFTAKKSKIKRANTIDIPSYLKLQAENQDSTGCISLRRPINVGDKSGANAANVIVPSFQPKTENDRKFLALINKNNEAPVFQQTAPFKTFGYTKTTDMSSLTNHHWNSRFSNIKTAFDKSSTNEEKDNRLSSKHRTGKRMSVIPQTFQEYGTGNDRIPKQNAPFNDYSVMKVDSSNAGFRHAPSSPFRRIGKPTPAVLPTKVPPTYHWSKNNAPQPTHTLREKARMLFDKDTSQTQLTSKPKMDGEHQEKTSFPRPPWLEHEKQDERSNATVTENGRIDYRSFCKQFAPFVGKSGLTESKKPREFEGTRHREHTVDDKNSIVVDGKISFKMVPDKRVQVYQYPVMGQRRIFIEPREKFGGVERKNSFPLMDSVNAQLKNNREFSEVESSKLNVFPDATLRGSSSVAVQTGINDEHTSEGRSFRVAPKIVKGPPSICSNAAVQTCNDFEQSKTIVSDMESQKPWKTMCFEHSDSNRALDSIYPAEHNQQFTLDHNQNYHNISSATSLNNPMIPVPENSNQLPDTQRSQVPDSITATSFQGTQNYDYSEQSQYSARKEFPRETEEERTHLETANQLPTIVSPDSVADNLAESEMSKKALNPTKSEWNVEDNSFLNERNIENQDISPDIGVVTRYACAIGTVSSVDSPEPHSEELGLLDSRTSSTPSPSQLWLCPRSKSRPESLTPEEEIRRHNMLQQSLVRRLQNEQTSLNDEHTSLISYSQSSGIHQSSSTNQTPSFNQSAVFQQPSNFDQPQNFIEPHHYNRSQHFLSPDVRRNMDPPTISSSPASSVTVNRVIALREAYEQPPIQSKPIQKERSPVANGGTPNDSSDEYLVSCATKSSRSIVLSKSESWHQLAVTNTYPRAPRIGMSSSTSSSPGEDRRCPPKPPKPRSPSSQKLRSKQFEASSAADSVKKMEDKIRRYFDSPNESIETRDSSRSKRSSPRGAAKGLVGLSRSRTMPGICGDKLRLVIPTPQMPLLNVNTADVDKVFDDLFEETTRTDVH